MKAVIELMIFVAVASGVLTYAGMNFVEYWKTR